MSLKPPKVAVFLCKMTKKSQKIRHFDRAPTFVSAGISAFWHFSTKNEAKFVQNNYLTNSRKYGIIVSESEGTTMNGLIYLGIFSLTIIIIILGLFKEMS